MVVRSSLIFFSHLTAVYYYILPKLINDQPAKLHLITEEENRFQPTTSSLPSAVIIHHRIFELFLLDIEGRIIWQIESKKKRNFSILFVVKKIQQVDDDIWIRM